MQKDSVTLSKRLPHLDPHYCIYPKIVNCMPRRLQTEMPACIIPDHPQSSVIALEKPCSPFPISPNLGRKFHRHDGELGAHLQMRDGLRKLRQSPNRLPKKVNPTVLHVQLFKSGDRIFSYAIQFDSQILVEYGEPRKNRLKVAR